MADKKKMSLDEILASCRGSDGGESAPEASEAPETPQPAAEQPAEKPAAKPAAPSKPGEMGISDILAAARQSDSGESAEAPAAEAPAETAKPAAGAPAKSAGDMSIADILASARGSDQAGKKETPKAKPAAKPGAKPAAKKASPKPAAKKEPAGPMDTSSILAAARSSDKPGPMSKAEAAAKGAAPAAKVKKAAPPMPAKPDYAKTKPAASKASKDDKTTRRTVFAVFFGSSLAIGFTTLGLTNLLWALGLARFMFPNILIEPPSRFKVGFPSDFSPETVEAKFKAQFGVWIVNTAYEGQQQIVALKSVCTHLGCTPNWLEAEQKFKCPCHGSGFYKDGVNFEGPAPRPLERYAISVADDGQIEIDKSKTFQEEMGQWTDSNSFVPV